jgi:hypothetical protein
VAVAYYNRTTTALQLGGVRHIDCLFGNAVIRVEAERA